MFFQFQNKASRLNYLENYQVKGVLVYFIAVSLLTSDPVHSFLKVAKIR